jgi:hypothetical protein
MAVDQRIQTTITAGRRSGHDLDQGPIMVILLGCLAVAMCFTTLGMGFVNIASSAAKANQLAAIAREGRAVAAVKPVEDPEAALKAKDEILEEQILALTRRKETLTDMRQAGKAVLDGMQRNLSIERVKAEQNRGKLEAIGAQEKQLQAKVGELRTRVAGASEEERRQLELRTQLERQLADIKGRIAQTVRRIQELRASIEDKKNSLSVGLLQPRDGRITTWIECTRGAIVLLPQGSRLSLTELSAVPAAFVRAIAGRHVEFLIRPDGFQSFNAARDAAEGHGASSIGYEPVDANWRLKTE